MLKKDLYKIYVKLPKMSSGVCRKACLGGKCDFECCTVTGCSVREKHLINRTIKKNDLDLPFITMKHGQGYILPNSLSVRNIREAEALKTNEKLRCSYLADQGCAIYEIRPLICRLFGTCKEMPCSYFPNEAKAKFPPEKLAEIGFISKNQLREKRDSFVAFAKKLRDKNRLTGRN